MFPSPIPIRAALVLLGIATPPVRGQEGGCELPPQVVTLGRSTPGTPGLPDLVMSGAPKVGAPFHLRLANGLPGAAGTLALGSRVAQTFSSALGATLFAGGRVFLTPFRVGADGSSLPLAKLDAVPLSLCGQQVVLQGFIADPAATGATAVTRALWVRFGTPESGPLLAAGKHGRLNIGESAADAELVDADLDGAVDQVICTSLGIRVALGRGDGTFSEAPLRLASINSAARMATDDLDGDGAPELAVVSLGTLVLFDGAGDGTFVPVRTIPDGGQDVTTGDWNEDGALDVLTTSASRLRLHLGNGDGTLQPPSSWIPESGAGGSLGVDLDVDGHLDIAVPCGGTDRVLTYLGNGDATFAAPVGTTVVPNLGRIQRSDLDRDGLPDLMVHRDGKAWYLRGNGQGGFTQPGLGGAWISTPGFVIGDLDRDGIEDLVSTTWPFGLAQLQVFLGTPQATLTSGATAHWPHLNRFAWQLGDVNQDGDPDLLCLGRPEPATTILLGTGAGSFVLPRTVATAYDVGPLLVGDLTADQRPDVAFTRYYGGLELYVARPDGTWEWRQRATGGRPRGLARADFDGDGAVDVVIAEDEPPVVRVLHGPQLQRATLTSVDPGPASVESADLDGDRIPDLVVGHRESRRFTVLRGVGDGTFTDPVSRPTSAPVVDLAIAAVDADAALDLIVLDGARAEVHRNDGAGSFALSAQLAGGNAVAVADLDGDGFADLAVTGNPNGLFLHRGRGDATFEALDTLFTGYDPIDVEAGDVNGDLLVDLVVLALDSASVSVHLGHGDGTFERALHFDALVVPRDSTFERPDDGLALADVNGDQILDVLVGGEDVGILENLLLGSPDPARQR